MTAEQEKLAYALIENPPAGSKLAEAKEYGIDLTLLVQNLKLTPTQRARKLEESSRSLKELRAAGELHRASH
jgi:hypothetical protein